MLPEHLHSGGIAGPGVPGTGTEWFDPHQVGGQIGGLEAVAYRTFAEAQVYRGAPWIDQDRRQGEFTTASADAAHAAAIAGVVLVMDMQPELTVEGVGGVVQRFVGFGADGAAGGGVHQDSGAEHLLRLVGVQHRHSVELPLQRLGGLARHQGHIGMGGDRSHQHGADQGEHQRPHRTYGTNCSQPGSKSGWGRRGGRLVLRVGDHEPLPDLAFIQSAGIGNQPGMGTRWPQADR